MRAHLPKTARGRLRPRYWISSVLVQGPDYTLIRGKGISVRALGPGRWTGKPKRDRS